MSNELVHEHCIHIAMRTRPKWRTALRCAIGWGELFYLPLARIRGKETIAQLRPAEYITRPGGKSFSRATGEHVFPECNSL
jgi:hypothetical protein